MSLRVPKLVSDQLVPTVLLESENLSTTQSYSIEIGLIKIPLVWPGLR